MTALETIPASRPGLTSSPLRGRPGARPVSAASAPLAPSHAISRAPLLLCLGMLVLSCLPDAMISPVLRELMVTRYDVSDAAAHLFMAINVLGGAMAVPLLSGLRRRMSPALLLGLGSAMNGLLLALMALPIGFAATLTIRACEGVADVLVLAVLFDLIGKSGRAQTSGRRFGLAGMVLMLSVATGLMLGGIVGKSSPEGVLWIGAIGCAIVGLAAFVRPAQLNGLVHSCPAAVLLDDPATSRQCCRRTLASSLLMSLADRAAAGILTVTVSLHLSALPGMTTQARGTMLGCMMLLMALLSWPAGIIGDRIGHLRLRTGFAAVYAVLLGLLAFVEALPMGIIATMLIAMGGFGSVLMPASSALASASGRGSLAMGAYHACGNAGWFLGIMGAAALMFVLPETVAGLPASGIVILIFAALHLAITIAAAALLMTIRKT